MEETETTDQILCVVLVSDFLPSSVQVSTEEGVLDMNIDPVAVWCCQCLVNSEGRLLLSCWKQQTAPAEIGFDNESCTLL